MSKTANPKEKETYCPYCRKTLKVVDNRHLTRCPEYRKTLPIKTEKNESRSKSISTLDKYLTPLIEKFSYKPEKDFAKYFFGKFNGKDIYLHGINGEMCMSFSEFATYIGTPYENIKKNFGNSELEENKHYFKIGKDRFLEGSLEREDFFPF